MKTLEQGHQKMHQTPAIQANHQLVKNLNMAWPKRATVCSMEKFQVNEEFDPAKPDYPIGMIPFFHHPKFEKLDDPVKNEVVTWGWIGYNQRTIAAEDFIVNPAFSLIADSELLGEDDWHFKEAMRQALVDEHYHTIMHMKAIERTKTQRRIAKKLRLPRSVTYRRLESLRADSSESWKKDYASIAFATVAEISVNAYLDMLASDQDIQAQNRQVAELHNRDEYAHGKILGEIGKMMYLHMNAEQRAFFVRILPKALSAFIAQDFSMWEAILTQLDVPDAASIIADTVDASRGGVIMRDYSGLHGFAEEIGILQIMDFDFSGTVKT